MVGEAVALSIDPLFVKSHCHEEIDPVGVDKSVKAVAVDWQTDVVLKLATGPGKTVIVCVIEAVHVVLAVIFKTIVLTPLDAYTKGDGFVTVLVAGEEPTPKLQLYEEILSGAETLDVLFKTTFVFTHALAEVKVAVGKAFTLTGIVKLSLQPLLVMAFNSTLNVPEVINVFVGFCVPLSGVPLLSKSQAQVAILSGAATLDVLLNIVVEPKQTVLAEIAITGFGYIVTVLVMVL